MTDLKSPPFLFRSVLIVAVLGWIGDLDRFYPQSSRNKA